MMQATAVSEMASYLIRDWGENFHFRAITEGPVNGSVIGEVWPSDGGSFYVGATRYGGTICRGDNRQVVEAALVAGS